MLRSCWLCLGGSLGLLHVGLGLEVPFSFLGGLIRNWGDLVSLGGNWTLDCLLLEEQRLERFDMLCIL